jgi:hypothetical protein
MINDDLTSPMGELYKMTMPYKRRDSSTLLLSDFFVRYELTQSRKRCKKIEELIEKYAFDIYKFNIDEDSDEDYFLLSDEFENLVSDIQKIHISNNYLGLMSWLINRAFVVTPDVNQSMLRTTLNKNRAALMNVLYHVSPRQFLQCFTGNMSKSG